MVSIAEKMERKHVHNSFEKHLLDFFFFFWICAKFLRLSYYKEKIPYDTMDSKIKFLHVIIGLINKGKQKQKPKWTKRYELIGRAFFITPVGGVQVMRIIRTI